jgi:hypothetical protein
VTERLQDELPIIPEHQNLYHVHVPKTIPGLYNIKAVSGGSDTACAINTSNQAYCWGNSNYAQLPFGYRGITLPTRVTAFSSVAQIKTNYSSGFAIIK